MHLYGLLEVFVAEEVGIFLFPIGHVRLPGAGDGLLVKASGGPGAAGRLAQGGDRLLAPLLRGTLVGFLQPGQIGQRRGGIQRGTVALGVGPRGCKDEQAHRRP